MAQSVRAGATRGCSGWRRRVQRVEVVHSGPELAAVYAQLRANCEAAAHALGQKAHTADRWIAATAMRVGIPLVSNNRLFRGAPESSLRRLRLL